MAAAKPPGRAHAGTLADAIKPRLKPVDAARRKVRLAELREAAREAGATDALASVLAGRRGLAGFLADVLETSPFLRSVTLEDPERLIAFLSDAADTHLQRLLNSTAKAWRGTDEAGAMSALRRARKGMALLVALADLGGLWDVEAVTDALTRFADAAIGAAVRFILTEAAAAGVITLPDAAHPDREPAGSSSAWASSGQVNSTIPAISI